MLDLSGDLVAVNRRAREAGRKQFQQRISRKARKALAAYWRLWRKRIPTRDYIG